MAELTVAPVNGEWMNNWFTPDAEPAAFVDTFELDGDRGDTDQAAGRLAGMITELDADVVALMEAPSRPRNSACSSSATSAARAGPTTSS